MRGGAAAAVPFYMLGVFVIEMWHARLRELSARQMALIGALLLGGISSIALLWPDDTETLVTLQQASAPPPAPEVAGLSAAAQKMPLRNPFSYAHETLAETTPPVENAKGDVQPPVQPASLAQLPSTSASTPPPPPPAPLVLRGVVTDANGVRIAILAKGTESAALAVGETWQGHTLRELTDRSATLDAASGSIIVTRE